MLSKRNLRVFVFTGVLLVLIYFIIQNAHATVTSGNSTLIDQATSGAVTHNKGKNKQTGEVDPSVGKEIQDIKNEVGIKGDDGESSKTDMAQEKEFDPAKEYQQILASSPMIVFSKSRCPFSQKIKELLKKEFEFSPHYLVVELDKHDHGAELQKYIGTLTGRSTVPNVIINGVSRGGNDDFQKLQEEDELLSSLKTWCGKALTVSKKEKPSNN
ncbi:LAQU0S06e02542g1_1 [Lachancea quebecensis]|uniref:LAQU0S06e02542g1_1 n=1 Tax=Lachancea quebecensis TaxID=1654605 RepID=A0A0P1KSS2_9SACH|nr:LAQU0S06e02542g1_1 [Lachancea quebecensis]